ncbi:flagellar hook-length control protein FliK [Bacillus rubiinfantis]|uniref:flagellar hook-length control protein FliK n=1 Tax=Bacillus rubiinfantis TaxID=1499680 RepID=UPI0005A94C0A|nr:flagellar hook-length control protein FliK [Bacillus rubiinfantis]
MDAAQIPIKINQTQQSDAGKLKLTSQTEVPTIPFHQILAMNRYSENTVNSKGLKQQNSNEPSTQSAETTEPEADYLLESAIAACASGSQQVQLSSDPIMMVLNANGNDLLKQVSDNSSISTLDGVHNNGGNDSTLSINEPIQLFLEREQESMQQIGENFLANGPMQDPEILNQNGTSSQTNFTKNGDVANEAFVGSLAEIVSYLDSWINQKDSKNSASHHPLKGDLLLFVENVGPVQVEVTNQNQQLSIKIITEDNSELDTLKTELRQLEAALQQQNIHLKFAETVSRSSAAKEMKQMFSPAIQLAEHLRTEFFSNVNFHEGQMQNDDSLESSEIDLAPGSASYQTGQFAISHGQTTASLSATEHGQQRVMVKISDFVANMSEWIGINSQSAEIEGVSKGIRLLLAPEHLGNVEVKLTALEGQISALIVTDTVQAKDILDGQLHHLKQALQQQGLTVQKLEIVQQPIVQADSSQMSQLLSQDGQHSFQEPRSRQLAKNGRDQKQKNDGSEGSMETPLVNYANSGLRTNATIDFTA